MITAASLFSFVESGASSSLIYAIPPSVARGELRDAHCLGLLLLEPLNDHHALVTRTSISRCMGYR
jgi:hypothetical protein